MRTKVCTAAILTAIICLFTGCQKGDGTDLPGELLGEGGTEAAEPEEGSSYNLETDSFGMESCETGDFGSEDTDKEGIEVENSAAAELGNEGTDKEAAFYYTPLTEEIKGRITGKSYPDTDEPLQISYEDLAYVHVLHYDFQAQIQEGELICNQAVAQDLVDIFRELYENQYPVEKIQLIDVYDADDEASMADNNTSCFNYRPVPGTAKLSNHSYGYAIDINPLYNPYVRTRNGEVLVSPDNARPYADRSAEFPYKIDKNDLCYQLFVEHGFTWGGAWNSSKDYQHFEKVVTVQP